ncbi:MAG: hypothetical protein R3C11_16900 [Planctomycetaceae bacterium]
MSGEKIDGGIATEGWHHEDRHDLVICRAHCEVKIEEQLVLAMVRRRWMAELDDVEVPVIAKEAETPLGSIGRTFWKNEMDRGEV